MAKKKPKPGTTYREGAKGRCHWCGRPEAEHKGGDCPAFRERNDQSDRPPKHFLGGDHYGVGLVR